VIMTPHAGEFERISGIGSMVQFDDALRNFSSKHNCIVVLKGPISRLCGPDGRVYYSLFGGGVLARGGPGDILAGLIAGIIANRPTDKVEECAACGLVWHGLAADALARECGQKAVRSTLLIKKLEFALRNI
jgi:ADP-dependent NAD(P)H-hydrate dehydratase / NAD(P)H-hydrate epimerase